MSTAIQKNVQRTAINTTIQKKINHGVDPDDERSKQQIAMCRDDVPDKLKNKAKEQQKPVRKSSNTILKKGDEVGRLWKNIAEI